MAQKTDDELIVVVTAKTDEYLPAAVEFAREELRRRGIEEIPSQSAIESQSRVEGERQKRMSSHWINIYAVVCCVFCAAHAGLSFFPRLTDLTSATVPSLVIKALVLVPFAAGVVAVSTGLFLRRQWAWKLNWICIGGWVLYAALASYPSFVLGALLGLLWSIPNFIYFRKRRHMFS